MFVRTIIRDTATETVGTLVVLPSMGAGVMLASVINSKLNLSHDKQSYITFPLAILSGVAGTAAAMVATDTLVSKALGIDSRLA